MSATFKDYTNDQLVQFSYEMALHAVAEVAMALWEAELTQQVEVERQLGLVRWWEWRVRRRLKQWRHDSQLKIDLYYDTYHKAKVIERTEQEKAARS